MDFRSVERPEPDMVQRFCARCRCLVRYWATCGLCHYVFCIKCFTPHLQVCDGGGRREQMPLDLAEPTWVKHGTCPKDLIGVFYKQRVVDKWLPRKFLFCGWEPAAQTGNLTGIAGTILVSQKTVPVLKELYTDENVWGEMEEIGSLSTCATSLIKIICACCERQVPTRICCGDICGHLHCEECGEWDTEGSWCICCRTDMPLRFHCK